MALTAHVEVDVRQLEEPDGVSLGDLALHDLTRNLARPQIEAAAAARSVIVSCRPISHSQPRRSQDSMPLSAISSMTSSVSSIVTGASVAPT